MPGDVLLLNAFVSASLHLSAVYPSFPVWHICVPNVVSCVSPVSLISPLDKIITRIITQAKWVPCSHTRCYHGDGRNGSLPVALGIWFQLKWKSEVLEWIIGVEPLNGQTFL